LHSLLISLCVLLQASMGAADDTHRLKCELVYMRDREEKLKQEVVEVKQELQVGRQRSRGHVICEHASHAASSHAARSPATCTAASLSHHVCFAVLCCACVLKVTKDRLEVMQEKLSNAQLDKLGLEQKVE
jgi:hypothetical protein